MKLNYNRLLAEIDEVLASDDIDCVQKNAWHIDVGLDLLNGYMTELAKHAIEAKDEWLIEWCKNLLIVTETEEGGDG